MKKSDLTTKLKELNTLNEISCTQKELDEYLTYGMLIETRNGYMTRNGNKINVDVITERVVKFNINLTNIISMCNEIANNENIKHIYCMTKSTYNKYKEQQLIITKQNIDYFRVFENELWRVVII